MALSACQLLLASAFLTGAAGVVGAPAPRLDATVVASIAVLGLLGTGLAYVLNYQIITSDGATVSGLALAGVALILVGVALTRKSDRKPEPALPE